MGPFNSFGLGPQHVLIRPWLSLYVFSCISTSKVLRANDISAIWINYYFFSSFVICYLQLHLQGCHHMICKCLTVQCFKFLNWSSLWLVTLLVAHYDHHMIAILLVIIIIIIINNNNNNLFIYIAPISLVLSALHRKTQEKCIYIYLKRQSSSI